MQDGETLPQAAARELQEETGLLVTPGDLGDVVATTSGYADLGWAAGVFRDDFFFHRVDAHQVDVSRFEDAERQVIIGHRWWTRAELSATTAPVYPFGLPGLLDRLVAGHLPSKPVALPWHHRDHEPPGDAYGS